MRLDGTKVLLTGTFGSVSQEAAVTALQERGAVIATELGMDVEVVFAGDGAGAEVDAAMELGVRVVDSAGLEQALKSDGDPVDKPLPEGGFIVSEVEQDEPAAGPPRQGSSQQANRADPRASAKPAGEPGDRAFGKGEQVRIIGGREGVGETGEIFWWGDSKFGEGMRAGVTGDDGTKYWVDEADLAWPDAVVDEGAIEEAIQEAKAANTFARGDSIRVKSGKHEDATGIIFWWGDSKWGEGMRAGVEVEGGEKIWVDGEHLEAVEAVESTDDIPF